LRVFVFADIFGAVRTRNFFRLTATTKPSLEKGNKMAIKPKKTKSDKNKHHVVVKNVSLEDEQISSDQPIECVFEDMSERLMRIMRDLLSPAFIFEKEKIQNTITIFGSARIKSEEVAKAELDRLLKSPEKTDEYKEKLAAAKNAVEMSKYFTDACELSRRLQEWFNMLPLSDDQKFYIMTGGGPGIMEAAGKGAQMAGGRPVGATILITDEQRRNPYVDKGVWVNFHYFLMRKFWLLFFAKALVVFPGGTGTFDEFFEVFTLMKTRKTARKIPTVLFGRKFWENSVNFETLIKADVITRDDLDFFIYADTVDEAFDYLKKELSDWMKKSKLI